MGKNFGIMEVRLILAQIIFNFDLELVEKEEDFMRCYGFWEKPELMVKMSPIGGS
jgi:hypothetical protein